MQFQRNKRKSINPTRYIVLGFGAIILLGTLLLHLPISAQNGQVTPWLTCLFTATSATCVTGLILVDTAVHWSVFGQADVYKRQNPAYGILPFILTSIYGTAGRCV